jgi:prophage maintenance system killer protein
VDLSIRQLQEDYERWKGEIGEEPYSSPKTIGIFDVLRAHYLIIDFFATEHGEGVGGIGPKSLTILHSTLNRQFSGYDGKVKWKTDYEICASLFWGLVKNHAFHDVNKRTALLSLFFHLVKVGRYPNAPHKTYEELAIRVAANKLEDYSSFSKYKGKLDAEVLFIADFLGQKTRAMEKTEYKITYRQLDSILRNLQLKDHISRNYYHKLASPNNNNIDVIKITEEKVGIFKRTIRPIETKVLSIGFPGWSRQVNIDVVKRIRRKTGLTHENGYDSETFYHGADSLPSLINEFQGLLQTLADK